MQTRHQDVPLGISELEAEDIPRTGFAAMRRTLPAKEQHDLVDQLPRDLEQLWRSIMP